jgi:hypothetical protein
LVDISERSFYSSPVLLKDIFDQPSNLFHNIRKLFLALKGFFFVVVIVDTVYYSK